MRYWLSLLILVCLVSAVAAEEMQVTRNIAYRGKEGHSVRNRLDVYAPAEGENLPVMVWVHGGGWKIGGKKLVNNKPKWFTRNGHVLVSINYRFHPDANYADQAADVAAAACWVRENIAELSGNPDRIFLMGHSAGAHLAALVATDHTYLNEANVPIESIAGVVLVDGAGYDIPRHLKTARKGLKSVYESVFTTDVEKQRAASPITYVQEETDYPPILILHCASRPDATVQAEALAAALVKVGGEASTYAAEGKTHLTINRDIGLEGDDPTTQIAEFLKRHAVENGE